jgi:hypothetical protein
MASSRKAFVLFFFWLSSSFLADANLADRRREKAFKRFEKAIQNTDLKDKTRTKLEDGKRLNLRERREGRLQPLCG